MPDVFEATHDRDQRFRDANEQPASTTTVETVAAPLPTPEIAPPLPYRTNDFRGSRNSRWASLHKNAANKK